MDYDVVVVGSGPSGSSCATLLGRKGIKTLLLDKSSFPREKTCGDGITGKSIRMLKELGVENKIIESQHALAEGLMTSAPSGVSMTFMPNETENRLYVCKRYVFDSIIFEEARKNADVIENFEVTDLVIENGKVAGVKGVNKNKKEQEFRAKVVVGADGATSIVARKLGLNDFDINKSLVAVRAYYENVEPAGGYLEFHFMEELLPGYFWIFPAGNNEYNVGIAVIAGDVSRKKINLKDKLNEIIAKSRLSGRFKNAKLVSEIKGWNLPTGAQKRKRAGDGFVLVGDAASLIDPFTGEGIGNALTSGKLAAETIADAIEKNDFSYNSLKAYEDNINAALGNEFDTNYKFQRFGKNPAMFNALVETLSRDKDAMKIATSAFMDPKEKRVTFKIPLRVYLRVLLRFVSDCVKKPFVKKN